MSKRGIEELLEDIKEAAGRIGKYIGGMDYRDFPGDMKTQDAVVRNVEIIGEAVKKLPKSFTSKYAGHGKKWLEQGIGLFTIISASTMTFCGILLKANFRGYWAG